MSGVFHTAEAPLSNQRSKRRRRKYSTTGGSHGKNKSNLKCFRLGHDILICAFFILSRRTGYHEVDHSPEVVDFGAATGANGGFGWYSDHPVGFGFFGEGRGGGGGSHSEW